MSNQESISRILKKWHADQCIDSKLLEKIRRVSDISKIGEIDEVCHLMSVITDFNISQKSALCLIGLVGNVVVDDPAVEFVCSLGRVIKRNRRPAYCEIHFERLCSTQKIELFYRRLKRVILVLQRKIEIASIVECVISWEHNHETEQDELVGHFSEDYLRRLRTSYYEGIND